MLAKSWLCCTVPQAGISTNGSGSRCPQHCRGEETLGTNPGAEPGQGQCGPAGWEGAGGSVALQAWGWGGVAWAIHGAGAPWSCWAVGRGALFPARWLQGSGKHISAFIPLMPPPMAHLSAEQTRSAWEAEDPQCTHVLGQCKWAEERGTGGGTNSREEA